MNSMLIDDQFTFLTKDQQLTEVLSNPCNVKKTAKFILICMDKRSNIIKTLETNSNYHTDPPENCSACNHDV